MSGPIVIKLGGVAVEDPASASPLLEGLAHLHREDEEGLVLLHGGGKAITRQLDAHGLESTIIDGIRVTPDSHIAQVVGVLAGQVNKAITAQLQALGQAAVGLSIGDGGLTLARPMKRDGVDFGFVGEIEGGDGALVRLLLGAGYLPVISPIGRGADGSLLNVNADSAAGALAQIIGARMLILLTDVPGILDADRLLIESIDEPTVEELIRAGVIQGGMVPKVRAALDTARAAGTNTAIASWNEPESIARIAAGGSGGTRIIAATTQGAGRS